MERPPPSVGYTMSGVSSNSPPVLEDRKPPGRGGLPVKTRKPRSSPHVTAHRSAALVTLATAVTSAAYSSSRTSKPGRLAGGAVGKAGARDRRRWLLRDYRP